MESLLTVLSAVFLLTGITLDLVAIKFRTRKYKLSFNPKEWIPVWKMKDHFRVPGYTLNLIGTGLIAVGGLLVAITYLIF